MIALHKSSLAAGLIFVVGAGLLLFSSESVLRYLQNLRFGSPTVVCARDLGVEFTSEWLLEVLYDGAEGSVALYGFLPIPKDWAKVLSPNAIISLRSLKKQGLHLAFHSRASIQAIEFKTNCSSSSSCRVTTISLGQTVEVGRVKSKDGEWIVLFDKPVSIGVQGGKWEEVEGIRLRACV